MKLDFETAAKRCGIRSSLRGKGGVSVFVDDEVMRLFVTPDGPGIPVFLGDIMTRLDDGAGVVTRPGVETGLLIPLKGRGGSHDAPVSGTRSMLATARKISSGDLHGPGSETVAGGLSAALRSIAFGPRPDNSVSTRVDAWRYVIGGAQGSGFAKMIDDRDFLMAIEGHVLRHRLFSSGAYRQPNPSTGIESAFPGMLDMVQEYEPDALRILFEEFGFGDVLCKVTSARPDEMSLWQVVEGNDDAACGTVEDACDRVHDWSEVMTDAFRSVIGKAIPRHNNYLVRIATAADTDVAFIMADIGAMIITWPSVTRNLIIPFRGLPHLSLSSFDVPSPDELKEYEMEAAGITSGPAMTSPEGRQVEDHASAA